MARYGTVPWGSVIYTDHDPEDNQSWLVGVDWNGDGVYDGNEARYTKRVIVRRGREYVIDTKTNEDGSVKGSGWKKVMIGEALVTVDNENGRYDVLNSSSALYPNMRKGKYAMIRTTKTGVAYPLITGKVLDIYPIGDTEVMIKIIGSFNTLEHGVTIDPSSTVRIDQAIDDVLDAAGWPTLWGRSIANTPDYLSWFWADGDNARALCHDLAQSAVGEFFEAADGKATFYSRYERSDAVITLDESDLGKDISVEQPWDVIYNKISFISRPRTALDVQEIGRVSSILEVEAGETIEVWVPFRYDGETVPCTNVQDPVSPTDYAMNSASTGLGTNLTASCDVALTITFATRCKLSISNSGSVKGYMTLTRVQGQPLAVLDEVLSFSEDTASQASFDIYEFELKTNWLQDVASSNSLCAYTKTILSTEMEYLKVTIIHHPALQFAVDLFSYVTLNAPSKGIVNKKMKVGFIEHETVTENMQETRTVLRLEPSNNLEKMFVLTAMLGVDTYLSP